MSTNCTILKKNIIAGLLSVLCCLCLSFTAFAETGDEDKGPGVSQAVEPESAELTEGESLGIFNTTGYCSCEKCSTGTGLTYSGTVPKANHTISADLTILPLGTKVRINDIIYTVEDIGSSVDGHKIDIYYSSHEEAAAHGSGSAEVFLISKPEEKKTKAPLEEPKAPVDFTGPGNAGS